MASVLHLLAPDLSTGTTRQIRYLVDGTRAAGWAAHVCSLEANQARKQRLQQLLPSVEWCQHSLRLDPTIVIRCARYLQSMKPDIVHCWGQHQMVFLPMSLHMAGIKNVVWSARSQVETNAHALARFPRTIVTNADHLARAIAPRHAVQTIRNGVEAFPPAEVVSPLHHELDLAPDSVFLAATGDLRSKKRLQDVVWAFDLLRVIRSNLHLLILGAGEPSSELRSFIRRAASAPGVHLLGYRDDVGNVLRQCSCLWQASEDEGCSNALLEAIAAGLPVVASDIPGHRETFQEADCGSLTPLGDCAAMARRTNLLLDDVLATEERRRQAQRHVLHEFCTSNMIANYGDFYARLLSPNRAAA